jgi:hypothetical protein
LAELLGDLLAHPETWDDYLVHAKAHLDAHRPSVVADRYMGVLAHALKVRGGGSGNSTGPRSVPCRRL